MYVSAELILGCVEPAVALAGRRDLSEKNLTGTIPTEVGQLTALTYMCVLLPTLFRSCCERMQSREKLRHGRTAYVVADCGMTMFCG